MTLSLDTPRGAVVIRQASPPDAVAFRDLRLFSLQESPTAFSADYQRTLGNPPQYWRDLLTMHDDESTIFVADHRSELLAMSGIVRGSTPKTRHSAILWGVYVRPEWRGFRIADEIIRACFTWAKARNIVATRLEVTATNTSAIRCYERCGFTITGTEPRALFHESHYYDFYLMHCSLDNP